MKRKTIEIESVKEIVNKQLSSGYWSQEQKRALCFALESILLDTGNYNGFNFIQWLDAGCKEWQEEAQRTGLDNLPTIPYIGEEYDRIYY